MDSNSTRKKREVRKDKANGGVVQGYAIIAKGDEPKPSGKENYRVPSQSSRGSYIVSRNAGWSCTCPDFRYRHPKVGDCKHVNAVRLWLKAKEKMEAEDKFELRQTLADVRKCKLCGSVDFVKWGSRKNKHGVKQIFKCRSCGRLFVVDHGFSKMHLDPKIVTLALDLYFKGASLRKVIHHIRQFYGISVSHVAPKVDSQILQDD